MVVTALGFVFGAWLLQQQATLLLPLWLPLITVSLLLIVVFRYFNTLQTCRSHSRLPITFIAASLIGFLYAATFAYLRLDDALPKEWEQKDITVVGMVATLSEVSAGAERFRFDVEQVLTPEAQVPKHILLNYYQDRGWQQPIHQVDQRFLLRPSTFKAGERWKLTVRLKRPHTTYNNPHGYDFEAWALAQNIRAMGYIRNQNGMEKLTDFVWRPRYVIESCREKVGERITQSLANQPYAGVIRALVIGDHSQIRAQDWDVYLRTGTNHLMSISYLLKR
jgi:competence protein ComEC